MELIHRDQAVIKGFYSESIDGKPKRRMGTDQHLIAGFQESLYRIDFPTIVTARSIAEIPVRFHFPIGKEPDLLIFS